MRIKTGRSDASFHRKMLLVTRVGCYAHRAAGAAFSSAAATSAVGNRSSDAAALRPVSHFPRAKVPLAVEVAAATRSVYAARSTLLASLAFVTAEAAASSPAPAAAAPASSSTAPLPSAAAAARRSLEAAPPSAAIAALAARVQFVAASAPLSVATAARPYAVDSGSQSCCSRITCSSDRSGLHRLPHLSSQDNIVTTCRNISSGRITRDSSGTNGHGSNRGCSRSLGGCSTTSKEEARRRRSSLRSSTTNACSRGNPCISGLRTNSKLNCSGSRVSGRSSGPRSPRCNTGSTRRAAGEEKEQQQQQELLLHPDTRVARLTRLLQHMPVRESYATGTSEAESATKKTALASTAAGRAACAGADAAEAGGMRHKGVDGYAFESPSCRKEKWQQQPQQHCSPTPELLLPKARSKAGGATGTTYQRECSSTGAAVDDTEEIIEDEALLQLLLQRHGLSNRSRSTRDCSGSQRDSSSSAAVETSTAHAIGSAPEKKKLGLQGCKGENEGKADPEGLHAERVTGHLVEEAPQNSEETKRRRMAFNFAELFGGQQRIPCHVQAELNAAGGDAEVQQQIISAIEHFVPESVKRCAAARRSPPQGIQQQEQQQRPAHNGDAAGARRSASAVPAGDSSCQEQAVPQAASAAPQPIPWAVPARASPGAPALGAATAAAGAAGTAAVVEEGAAAAVAAARRPAEVSTRPAGASASREERHGDTDISAAAEDAVLREARCAGVVGIAATSTEKEAGEKTVAAERIFIATENTELHRTFASCQVQDGQLSGEQSSFFSSPSSTITTITATTTTTVLSSPSSSLLASTTSSAFSPSSSTAGFGGGAAKDELLLQVERRKRLEYMDDGEYAAAVGLQRSASRAKSSSFTCLAAAAAAPNVGVGLPRTTAAALAEVTTAAARATEEVAAAAALHTRAEAAASDAAVALGEETAATQDAAAAAVDVEAEVPAAVLVASGPSAAALADTRAHATAAKSTAVTTAGHRHAAIVNHDEAAAGDEEAVSALEQEEEQTAGAAFRQRVLCEEIDAFDEELTAERGGREQVSGISRGEIAETEAAAIVERAAAAAATRRTAPADAVSAAAGEGDTYKAASRDATAAAGGESLWAENEELTPAQRFYLENRDLLFQRAHAYYQEKQQRAAAAAAAAAEEGGMSQQEEEDADDEWSYSRDPVLRPPKGHLWDVFSPSAAAARGAAAAAAGGGATPAEAAEECSQSSQANREPMAIHLVKGRMPSIEQFIALLQQEKFEDVRVVDLEACGRRDVARFAIIATGRTPEHCRRTGRLLSRIIHQLEIPYLSRCSYCHSSRSDDWIVARCAHIHVHLMTRPVRIKYRLEDLWLLPHEHFAFPAEFAGYFDFLSTSPPPYLRHSSGAPNAAFDAAATEQHSAANSSGGHLSSSTSTSNDDCSGQESNSSSRVGE